MKMHPAADVARFAATHWDIPADCECEIVRRGFNDHYRLTSDGRSWFARVYLWGKWWIRRADDYVAELEILHGLEQRGLQVVAPLRARDGSFAIAQPEDGRPTALFPAFDGAPLRPEEVGAQIAAIGRQLAELHDAMDELGDGWSRCAVDTNSLIDEPMEFIAISVRRRRGIEMDFFDGVVEELHSAMANRSRKGPGFGLCHGDPHLRNILYSPREGAYLLDFDHACYSWRSLDVANFMMNLQREHHEAFLQGYQSRRPMSGEELALLPIFGDLVLLRGLRDVLSMFPTWGLDVDGEVFDSYIDWFMNWTQDRLLRPALVLPSPESA